MWRISYFSLTREFNAEGRIAIMSKDGDWILKESREACHRVLSVLSSKGAHYRPGAPLDTRWLAGGWSSHFEFADERNRRIRCDFFSRPPRVPEGALKGLFSGDEPDKTNRLRVVDLALTLMGRPSSVTVTVNPSDRPLIEEVLPALTDRLLASAHAAIEEDAAITPGGCIVRTGRGSIDATIDGQLDRIARALLPPPPAADAEAGP